MTNKKNFQNYLEAKFKHFKSGIILHQKNYVNVAIKKFRMMD